MDSNQYANLVLQQLSSTPQTFEAPLIKEMSKGNARAVMQEIIVQRLASSEKPIEKKSGSLITWAGGIAMNRNSRVNDGFWASMPMSQILNLKQVMAGQPAAFLFCHYDVEAECIHAWSIPEDLAIKSMITLPDGKTNSKNIFISLDTHRIKNATFAPNLDPFYKRIALTSTELNSLTAGIKQDHAIKKAASSPQADSDLGEDEIDDGEVYTAATVDFVCALPMHVQDKEWHERNRDRYQLVLRSPTSVLFESLRSNYIEKLDPAVAGTSRNISVLRKNDFGRGEFYPHYWAAFYAPETHTKTKSPQLFLFLDGDAKIFRYGFAFGRDCENYQQNLFKAINDNHRSIKEYIRQAPPNTWVSLSALGEDHPVPIEKWGALLSAKDSSQAGADATQPISIYREFPLGDLPSQASSLGKEIGEVFNWLWPFFQASRSGNWIGTAAVKSATVDDDESEIIDEEAPRTLAELSKLSSLPIAKLEQIEEALLTKHQIILSGPPGTSKTYIAQLFARYFVVAGESRSQGEHTTVYMHSNWGYEDFFEGIRPVTRGEQLSYESRKGRFLKWIDSVQRIKGPKRDVRHVMVIDEINRCDTASVLGELLQLMEFRGRNVELMSGSTFYLPESIYIIGTMNSADRSIGRIDLALRRRFLWINLFPDYQVLQNWLDKPGNNLCGFSSQLLKDCNQLLSKHGIQEDQQIGHALFMVQTSGNETEEPQDKPLIPEALTRIVRYSVVPYVSELCMMQLGKMDVDLAVEIEKTLLSCLQKGDQPKSSAPDESDES